MSAAPFISNDTFIFYSDMILIDTLSVSQINNMYMNALHEPKNKHMVVFVKTELLDFYLPILNIFPIQFILITTTADDACVPYYFFPPKNPNVKKSHDELLELPNLLRWITKNPSIRHPKLAPLPMGPKWQYTSHNFFGEDKAPILRILHTHCQEPLELFKQPASKPNLLYFSFGQTTNQPFFESHKNMREDIVTILSPRFPQNSSKPFEEYLVEMKTHKFALSPPGRGIDTHRAWEALMVGTIPIMISTPLDSLYDNLPVLIIEDWNILTPEFLEKEYCRIFERIFGRNENTQICIISSR